MEDEFIGAVALASTKSPTPMFAAETRVSAESTWNSCLRAIRLSSLDLPMATKDMGQFRMGANENSSENAQAQGAPNSR